MTLQQLTNNLELSRKLKELGVKQDSLYIWYFVPDNKKWNDNLRNPRLGRQEYKILPSRAISGLNKKNLYYSAFTSGELMELLPYEVYNYHLEIIKTKNGYEVNYVDLDEHFNILYLDNQKSSEDDNLSNAIANMLIYLLERGIIKL
jgi:hypothetical protein